MESELTHLQKRLKEEGDKVSAFFETLPADQWERVVYTEGSHWRIRQILAHFISAESAYQRYLEDVLRGGSGAPSDLDIDQFNEVEVADLESTPVEVLLEGYARCREKTLDLLESLHESDLGKIAFHPWFGDREVGWLLRLIYRHNTLHLQDVRKAIRSGEPVPHSDAHRVGRVIQPKD
jgi:hypothetical protein